MVAEQMGNAVADDLASDPVARRAPLVRSDPMMYSDPPSRRDSQIRRAPNAAGLYDVLDLILDKGIVIDAFVRVSLVGIELVTIDLRVVIASVDTYLRYAEGVERLQITERSGSKSVPDIMGNKMKADTVKQGAQKIGQAISGNGSGDDEDDDAQGSTGKGVMPALAGGVRKMLTKGVGRIVGRIAGDDRYEDDDQGQEQQQDDGEQEKQQAQQRQQKGEGGGGGRNRAGKPQPGGAKARSRR